MDSLALMFKPEPFSVTDRNDPELYLQEWLEYVERFNKFLKAVPGALLLQTTLTATAVSMLR